MSEIPPRSSEKKLSPWEKFLQDFSHIQDEKRVKITDLQMIDRIQLSDREVGIFNKLQAGTLNVEELVEAEEKTFSRENPSEDSGTRGSRKHFYAWVRNELNVIEGRKQLAEMRARREAKKQEEPK